MTRVATAAVVLVLAASAAGCRASARIVSADAPEAGRPVLAVRSQVVRLSKRAGECRVVAEYAGHRGEANVDMTPGVAREEVTTVIRAWTPAVGVPADVLRVTFYLRDKPLSRSQFPPPFDARLLALPGAQPTGPPPAQAPSATRDLLREAPPPNPLARAPAPCPVCQEPRGDASPCPHCGMD
ncbi:MAG: hypothetical protein KF878_17660 [Planctomycetes bacterium]|nr:hypothetical protein [Planctomycetota bacterium]